MKVNPEMVTMARNYSGVTQAMLAKSLKVTQGRISKIEMGILECDEVLLSRIADILKFPVEFFTQQKRVYGLPLSVHGDCLNSI